MADAATIPHQDEEDGELKRSITGRLLFFYTLGDVLGSGIYVLIGLVAAAVGGAFWIAFALGVTVAAITGSAYAELVDEVPPGRRRLALRQQGLRQPAADVPHHRVVPGRQHGGVGLARGRLRVVLRRPCGPVRRRCWCRCCSSALLVVVNFIGITESVVDNMLMTFVEVAGLLIVLVIGIIHVGRATPTSASLTHIDTSGDYGSPALAVLAGISFSFFAMTGFENTANVAEETIDPYKSFPRSLVGGMVVAGLVYVLVSMAAALTVPDDTLATSDAALLEVVKAGILPFSTEFMTTLFSIIALIAITNTTLVHDRDPAARSSTAWPARTSCPASSPRSTRSRRSPWVGLIFSGAVVGVRCWSSATLVTEAGGGIDLVGRLATVTVVLLLAIYAIVIVACLKLRGQRRGRTRSSAPTRPLLLRGPRRQPRDPATSRSTTTRTR